jgi:hypothetical protein
VKQPVVAGRNHEAYFLPLRAYFQLFCVSNIFRQCESLLYSPTAVLYSCYGRITIQSVFIYLFIYLLIAFNCKHVIPILYYYYYLNSLLLKYRFCLAKVMLNTA